MRWIIKTIARLALALGFIIVLLFSPVAWVEFTCHGDALEDDYQPLLPAEYHRNEAASWLTYPEWHIVHAYADYGEVIRTGDPHDMKYISSVVGFWTSLCSVTETADLHGGADDNTMLTIYTIGISFTAEMMLKAAYEETVGRIFTMIRGEVRTPLDNLSAEQAGEYATFLQQVPWYKYPFANDSAELRTTASDAIRDKERAIALGIEFAGKAAYAKIIDNAVAAIGQADLTIRSVIDGLSEEELAEIEGVSVVETIDAGIVIETPRYREFTNILVSLSDRGGTIIEIAGNDEIMLTAILTTPAEIAGMLTILPRQGYGDERVLVNSKISDLAATLANLSENGAILEHIHDY